MKKYILSIDQSTTATKALLYNNDGILVSQKNVDHKQYFPNPGWVEHDAEEIYRNTKQAVRKVIEKSGISGTEIAALALSLIHI